MPWDLASVAILVMCANLVSHGKLLSTAFSWPSCLQLRSLGGPAGQLSDELEILVVW